MHDRRRYREKDPERSVPRFCVKPTLPIEFFIAEMVEYDYTLLGAPWIDSTRWCMQHGRCSGNSGLSLWNVRTMEALARRSVEWRSNHSKLTATNWEIDAHAHALIVQNGGRLPPTELAEKFSMEQTRRLAWFSPFGCHSQRCCPGGTRFGYLSNRPPRVPKSRSG